MRYWPKRIKLFLSFREILSKGREIEIAVQKTEQEMHDVFLSNSISHNQKEKELEYKRGIVDGLKKALEIAHG